MATRNNARRNTAVFTTLCYLVTIPFLILVLIGNVRRNNAVLNDIYFFKIDVSQIIPISVGNSNLLNSVARSLGLHDFYQVGLWNFCEGYNDEGVTYCSKPVRLYWFNPVEVLVSELLAGAQIALPSNVVTVLNLLKIGSQAMYVCFMAGTIINFVLLFITALVIRARWFSFIIGFIAFASGVFVTVGAIIATVISVAAKVALTAQDQLNIQARIGVKMFVFMWIGAILTDLAFLLQAAMCCCCKPHRPSREASPVVRPTDEKKGMAMPNFVRRRRGAAPAS